MTSSATPISEKDGFSSEVSPNGTSSEAQSSIPSSFEEPSYTKEEERQLVRKIDLALIPGLTFLYLLSFLDRTNVGNAKLYGMLTDIGAKDPAAYNTALALYFLGYVLFEVPANLVLKKYNPRRWLPTLTVVWGITCILQGFVRSQSGFYAARFFLGVSEAGLFPGCLFVFSMYYKRRERHWRVAVFFGGAAVAGAFGGILAWSIGHMTNVGHQPRWAWIFFLEGAFTVLVGLSAYFWVPGYPRDAKFLNERELSVLIARLSEDGDAADDEPFDWKGVVDAFKDPIVLAYCFLFHGFAFPLYSLSLFLPTIISGLGYASWQAQLLTVPPYTAAFLAILFVAFASHRSNKRGLWIALGGGVAIIGYIVILSTSTSSSRYGGVFITVVGIYGANALLLSWPAENVSPQTKRATATAMQIFIGDIGAIAGVLVYRPQLNADFYRTPHLVAVGYTLFGIAVALSLWVTLAYRNKRRAMIGNSDGALEKEKLTLGQARLGDQHPSYLYQL